MTDESIRSALEFELNLRRMQERIVNQAVVHCFFDASALYERSAPDLYSRFSVRMISGLFQTMSGPRKWVRDY